MRDWIIRRLGGEISVGGTPTVAEILSIHDKAWHPDHIRSRRLDTEEKLHFQRLWLTFSKIWAVVGNAALWAAAILVETLILTVPAGWLGYIYGAAAVSTLTFPCLVLYAVSTRPRFLNIAMKPTGTDE